MRIKPLTDNITRGYGLLEGFLARQRCNMANKLIPAYKRKGILLDIGCGSYPLFLMNTQFSKKYGMDQVSENDQFREHNISVVNFNIEKGNKLPFDDNFFDVITMLAVFEHIEPERLIPVLQEIHRTLKPDGMYILTTPAIWTDGLLRFMAKLRLVSPVEIEEHKDAYSHKKISYFLEKANFLPNNLRFGYFELFMNIWAIAKK